MILASFGHTFLHVTGGDNGSGPFYLEWSGWVGAVEGLTFVGAVIAGMRHLNCREPRCWRPGHQIMMADGTHIRTCHRHHPTHPRKRRSHSVHLLHAQHGGHRGPPSG